MHINNCLSFSIYLLFWALLIAVPIFLLFSYKVVLNEKLPMVENFGYLLHSPAMAENNNIH